MDIKLPKLGEGADSGVVVNLFVKEGDAVIKDQPLLEIENEKAVASIPAPDGGVISKIHVKPGDKVNVGQRIMTLASAEGAEAPVAAASTPAPRPEREPKAAPAETVEDDDLESGDPVAAPVTSPSIRKLARELGIDLRRIRGSERGGRIVMNDLRDYIQRLQNLTRPAGSAPAAPAGSLAPAPKPEPVDFSKWGPVTLKPMTSLRQTISRRMLENWNTIPHVTQFDEADTTVLGELRRKHAPSYEAQGARLTLTVFLVKALVAALRKHPLFNASLDEAAGQVVFKDYFHIGIAVDTEAGLLVPVIRDADKKSMLDIARDLEDLAKKARERKVSADDLKGGTFTISNQGGIGGGHFTPIINKPEVAILGVGRGSRKALVTREGGIEPRPVTPLALSYDHRLIDGGSAARFIVDLVNAIQEFPESEVKL
jgi:pyruvate dehydrogenase E2 component (dihydrolipoamide acetyltransferase)